MNRLLQYTRTYYYDKRNGTFNISISDHSCHIGKESKEAESLCRMRLPYNLTRCSTPFGTTIVRTLVKRFQAHSGPLEGLPTVYPSVRKNGFIDGAHISYRLRM